MLETLRFGDMEVTRTKYSGLDTQTKVRFILGTEDDGGLVASRGGILVEGPIVITNPLELQQFAKLVDAAWRDHLLLKPDLAGSSSGH